MGAHMPLAGGKLEYTTAVKGDGINPTIKDLSRRTLKRHGQIIGDNNYSAVRLEFADGKIYEADMSSERVQGAFGPGLHSEVRALVAAIRDAARGGSVNADKITPAIEPHSMVVDRNTPVAEARSKFDNAKNAFAEILPTINKITLYSERQPCKPPSFAADRDPGCEQFLQDILEGHPGCEIYYSFSYAEEKHPKGYTQYTYNKNEVTQGIKHAQVALKAREELEFEQALLELPMPQGTEAQPPPTATTAITTEARRSTTTAQAQIADAISNLPAHPSYFARDPGGPSGAGSDTGPQPAQRDDSPAPGVKKRKDPPSDGEDDAEDKVKGVREKEVKKTFLKK